MRAAFLLSVLFVTACGSSSSSPDGSGPSGPGGGGGESSGGAGGDANGGGGSGAGNGGGACVAPETKLDLSLLDGVCYAEPTAGEVLDGVFEATPTGFRVSAGASETEVGGPQPSIPDGTLVRLTWQCGSGVYGGPGAFVLLENLPELDGDLNPTEAGTRLWFFEAAGGNASVPDGVPFDTEATPHCKQGSAIAYREPHVLTVSGPDFQGQALPGETETFQVPSGPNAGSYDLENVNWTNAANADAWVEINYRISRTP